MTACVAISPDTRMDSSSACDNLHGCMSDDLDPPFRPSVGMLKVDVISAYMTAAAEIAEREERVSANTSPDSARVHNEEVHGTPACESEKSDEISALKELNIAEREGDAAPIVLQDLGKRDDEEDGHHAVSEKSTEFLKQMEANAAVVESVEASPSVQWKAEEESTSSLLTHVPVESSQAFIEEETEVGEVAQHATAEASDVDITDRELAKVSAQDAGIVVNVEAGDEEEFVVTESAVTSEENFDRTETPDLVMHEYSNSTTTATNPVIETLDPMEELTVPESIISAETECGATDSVKLTESITNLAKSHPFEFTGLNHVALCCESLERSLDFYCGLLGLKTNLDRPELPYRGAWLLLGAEGIHIMEVPNPDPVKGRPLHGGYDRHACLNVKNVDHLRMTFDKAGINYQLSMVPSIFCRDPDGNGLEFIEVNGVHVD